MIYGNPRIHIDSDTTDPIGIRTLILSKIWQASRDDLSPEQIEAERPPIPSVAGGVMLVGDQTRSQGGVLRTTWTFLGIHGDGKSVTFKDRNHSMDYRFEPGFAEVSIVGHPKFAEILEKYGGMVNDGQVTWPANKPQSTSAGKGLGSSNATANDPNPMYGHENFFRMEGTYRFRYVDRILPANLYTQVGKVFESGNLPGVAPVVANRNWLKLPPQFNTKGPVYEIQEDYWLSGDGGWPIPIYGRG